MKIPNPLDLPPEVALRFVEDMRAFFAEKTGTSKTRSPCANCMHSKNINHRVTSRCDCLT